MAKIRVLLAEDHTVVREGLREVIQREQDLEVVGEAANGREAVELTAKLRPDVVLMDITMPVLNGIEATKQVKALDPRVAVLILTAYDDDQYVFALLEAGAAGYLLKNVRSRDLVEAIRSVQAGESVLHPAVARKVIRRFLAKAGEHPGPKERGILTERELEVLCLAASGITNAEMAERLVVSVRTIQAHLANTFKKLSVGSRTEAVLYALKKGWFTVDQVGC
ncbi:MAG: response regulator transcription factor [Chloroflexota bacterium]|nr:response regulator transcription factor [Chloroflexota bacterium]